MNPGAMRLVFLLLLIVRAATGAGLAAGPANDNFAQALALQGDYARSDVDTSGATAEPGEPPLLADPAGKSVWWTWTARQSGPVVVTTQNSPDRPWEVAIFRGDSVSQLQLVTNRTQRCVFTADRLATYRIGIARTNGAGRVTLELAAADSEVSTVPFQAVAVEGEPVRLEVFRQPGPREWRQVELVIDGRALAVFTEPPYSYVHTPVPGTNRITARVRDARGLVVESPPFVLPVRPRNDSPSNPTLVEGHDILLVASNEGATRDFLGLGSNQGGHAVWYRWQAPNAGLCTLSGHGLAGWRMLALAHGPSSPPLPNDVPLSGPPPADLLTRFWAVAGAWYLIGLDGLVDDYFGPFQWRLRLQPPNDDFARRRIIRGSPYADQGTLAGSSREGGEPAPEPEAGGTVWWSFTPERTGRFRINVRAGAPVAVAVYAGTKFDTMSLVASARSGPDDRVELRYEATPFNTYSIVLTDLTGAAGGHWFSQRSDAFQFASPSGATVLRGPASLLLSLTPPPGEAAITGVEYRANGLLVGRSGQPPFEFAWNGVPAATYQLEATLRHADGTSEEADPTSLVVHTNAIPPRTRVFGGGPHSDRSFVATGAGRLWTWGRNDIVVQGRAFAEVDQFGVPLNFDYRLPQPAQNPGPGRRWTEILPVRGESYALDDLGNLYLNGTVRLPGSGPGRRWVSLHQIDPDWPKSAEFIALDDAGRLWLDGTDRLGFPGAPARALGVLSIQRHLLLLGDDGRLLRYAADLGAPGPGTAFDPPTVGGRWVALTATLNTLVALADDGGLFGSGDLSPASPPGFMERLPQPAGVHRWLALAAGAGSLSALGDDGEVYVFRPRASDRRLADPQRVERPQGVARWLEIGCGAYHTIALGSDGRVYAWGLNGAGQLGLGLLTGADQPTAVVGPVGTLPAAVPGGSVLVLPLTGGRSELLFQTKAGRTYRIRYSDDGHRWREAPTPVAGTGGTVFWTDGGPPETEAPPAALGHRIYEVRATP